MAQLVSGGRARERVIPTCAGLSIDGPTTSCPAVPTCQESDFDVSHHFRQAAPRGGFCDGVSRRDFLTVGGTVVGGALSLPHLLAAEAQSGVTSSHKAIINVYLPGGPPHIDMWDLKPDAPAEIRGEFKPIKTNVPGIEICELFPQPGEDDGQVRRHSLACRQNAGDHDAFQCMTGRKRDPQKVGLLAGAWVRGCRRCRVRPTSRFRRT